MLKKQNLAKEVGKNTILCQKLDYNKGYDLYVLTKSEKKLNERIRKLKKILYNKIKERNVVKKRIVNMTVFET